MVENIRAFINDFLSRAGSIVFSSVIISRLLSFFASWIALQLIPDKELGIVIYAFQIVSFIIPISGMGLHQSLVRYGALLESNEAKNQLFIYVLKYGILISIGLILLLFGISFMLDFALEKTQFYLVLLSISLVTNFMFELIKIQFRLHKNNKLYAYADICYNVLLVVLVFGLSYYLKELGYALAIIITPFIVPFLFMHKLDLKSFKTRQFDFINVEFWKYGFFASLSNVTTQLLISVDMILIGNILHKSELVTAFRYVSLLPYSILFLSQVFMITDFVTFTENIKNKAFIKKYISNYTKLFAFVSIGILASIFIFGNQILAIFSTEYTKYFSSLMALTVGACGILILRGLFGNLLSSIGKAHINFVITSIAVVLNLALNYYLIPKYELFGAALTSASLMWFTGILSGLLFYYYYKKEVLVSK